MRTSWTSVALALLLAVALGDVLAPPAVAAGQAGVVAASSLAASSLVAMGPAGVARQPAGTTTTPGAPNTGISKQEATNKLWMIGIAVVLLGLVFGGRRMRKRGKKSG